MDSIVFFQAEDGIRDLVRSRGLGDVYKRQVTHNITGMFGVIEGASSDLRTGLTKQMVEIHEPLRLQVLVEAKTEILGQIYERQAIIRELVGGGWILLSAIDPDSGEISVFERGVGFVPWQAEKREMSELESSVASVSYTHLTLPTSDLV